VAPSDTPWGTGSVTDAALWLCATSDRLKESALVVALLPDVLRSGSRYGKWRRYIAKRLAISSLTNLGQFDGRTDIDVFALTASKQVRSVGQSASWPGDDDVRTTFGDHHSVMVGPVVEHRDPHTGPWVPYITIRDLPQSGDHLPGRSRRFQKRLFEPPFVAIRRTSRPTDGEPRIRAVVVRGDRPVAVENHLIVVRPARATVKDCRRIAKFLESEEATDWLNERIRTRHLTTIAVKEIPVVPDFGRDFAIRA
jgi:hypothetical protein